MLVRGSLRPVPPVVQPIPQVRPGTGALGYGSFAVDEKHRERVVPRITQGRTEIVVRLFSPATGNDARQPAGKSPPS